MTHDYHVPQERQMGRESHTRLSQPAEVPFAVITSKNLLVITASVHNINLQNLWSPLLLTVAPVYHFTVTVDGNSRQSTEHCLIAHSASERHEDCQECQGEPAVHTLPNTSNYGFLEFFQQRMHSISTTKRMWEINGTPRLLFKSSKNYW